MTDHHREPRLLPIGELSRTSGLTVSAVRFYDHEGLLVPADVDPQTGYRRYSPAQVRVARLLAGMRRVGMPVAEMAAVLEALPDTAAAVDLLDAHLRRLEDGLSDARREVSRLGGLLTSGPEGALELTVEASALARAIDSVRYAASADPDFPMLCAVLLEPHAGGLRLIATDRYRLAVAEVDGAPGGHDSSRRSLLPTALVDRVRRALWESTTTSKHDTSTAATSPVTLRLSPTGFSATLVNGTHLEGDALDLDFPDYRRLLHDEDPGQVRARTVPVADILAGLATRSEPHVHLDDTGVTESTGQGLLVDRAFLWEAASTVGAGYAVLPADGEIAPLALRSPDGALVSLVMPIRPEPAP